MTYKAVVCCVVLIFSPIINAFSASDRTPSSYHFASIEYLVEQEVGRIVLTQIYENIGINITISPLPGDRAQFAAKSGKKDGEIMRIWTYGEENKNLVRVPTPYYYLETMPFILKGKQITVTTKNDLQQYKLAKVRGVKHTNNITQGLSDVYNMNSTTNMFKLLRSGRVDIALTNTLDGNHIIAKHGLNDVTPLDKPLVSLPLYHYVHAKHKHLVPVVDAEIQRLKGNGELARLLAAAEQRIVAIR